MRSTLVVHATPSTTVSNAPGLVDFAHGMNLDAATTVDGRDRRRLERVCKYPLRPCCALDALHLLPDACVRLDLPRKAVALSSRPGGRL